MRWLVFGAGGLAMMAGNMFNLYFSSILPEIAQSLNIDIVVANSFMWGFMLAAVFSLIAGGFLCDQFGVLFVLVLSALLSAGGAVLMPWAGHVFSKALVGFLFVFILKRWKASPAMN